MAHPGFGSAAAHAAVRSAPGKQLRIMALSTADEAVQRALATQPAPSVSTAQPGASAVVSRRRRRQGLVIPGGWIPVKLLHELERTPSKAADVAEWCKHHLLTKEEMRAWWQHNPGSRSVALGEMAVQLGRLELMLGWIQQGGLTLAGGDGGETEPGTHVSHGAGADADAESDPSLNRGPFPARCQAPYAQGAGMFVGYLYSELLKLDDPTISESTMDGCRGAERVMRSSRPKLWPIRNLDEPFGAFLNWKDDVRPRAGDVVVLSFDEFTHGIGNEEGDTRTPTHVAMVEAWDESARKLRTIDGNAPLLPGGDRLSHAVSGRGYDFAAGNTDGLDETMFRYHQSRVICAVRMTERSTHFEAPASPPDATGPSSGELLHRLLGANAQVQAVLNHVADVSTQFDATPPVRLWVRDREP